MYIRTSERTQTCSEACALLNRVAVKLQSPLNVELAHFLFMVSFICNNIKLYSLGCR
jgi:hypothetical protein